MALSEERSAERLPRAAPRRRGVRRRAAVESLDDAKARAEADLRGGDQFEDIQDSWPEEIVSVEALAVEPYPELE